MSKIKLSFSFLLSLFLVAMFSIVASAAGTNGTNPASGVTSDAATMVQQLVPAGDELTNDNGQNNVNKTGVGASGQVHTSVGHNVSGQGTHGNYQNNTNSCATCHQTHTGAAPGLLFKNSAYNTCTACHDGTSGPNVFTIPDLSKTAATKVTATGGTFGGTHDGNMSAHMDNDTVKISAAPGGNHNPSESDGAWNSNLSCTSCHAPHGSYSDRLLNENPNNMGATPVDEGGKKVVNVPVVDSLPTATAATPEYLVKRIILADPIDPAYAAKGLGANDMVLQLYSRTEKTLSTGTTYSYQKETDPWLHGYEFDDSHSKHYWTAFTSNIAIGDLKASFAEEPITTDNLAAGEKLGNGFIGFVNPANTNLKFKYQTTSDPADKATGALTKPVKDWLNSLTSGNIARAYVVSLINADPTSPNYGKRDDSALWAGGANAGKGVAMSQYCASCHTDYLSASATSQEEEGLTPTPTGHFSQAYRHDTISDSYTCVRCHFAHGTDISIMKDAQGNTVTDIAAANSGYALGGATDPATDRLAAAKAYMLDINPSSALKRFTNMSVCWGCHTSSHSEGTRNTSSYDYNNLNDPMEKRDGNGLPTGN